MSPTVPFLHRNARSRKITSAEIREVYIEEIVRGVPAKVPLADYIRKVMP